VRNVGRRADIVQALCTGLEMAGRRVYGDPAYAKQVARKEFPDLPGDVVDKAIDAEIEYKIPAESVLVDRKQWDNLMAMQRQGFRIKRQAYGLGCRREPARRAPPVAWYDGGSFCL